MDGVRSMWGSGETVGILDLIIQLRGSQWHQSFLILRLIPVESEFGNGDIVISYRNKRYAYELSG